MRLKNSILGFVLMMLCVSAFSLGCKEKSPLEKAGERTGEIIKDAGRSVEDAVD
jgi:hypothetical protein